MKILNDEQRNELRTILKRFGDQWDDYTLDRDIADIERVFAAQLAACAVPVDEEAIADMITDFLIGRHKMGVESATADGEDLSVMLRHYLPQAVPCAVPDGELREKIAKEFRESALKILNDETVPSLDFADSILSLLAAKIQGERERLWGELEDIRCSAGEYLPGIERLMEALKKGKKEGK
jgi:hypothetical protein